MDELKLRETIAATLARHAPEACTMKITAVCTAKFPDRYSAAEASYYRTLADRVIDDVRNHLVAEHEAAMAAAESAGMVWRNPAPLAEAPGVANFKTVKI